MKIKIIVLSIFLLLLKTAFSQDEEIVHEHFRSTRVINLHNTESLTSGILELKICHRFGAISGGVNQLFGLDQATMRIALEYGVTDKLMVGFGRSTYQKTLDGFIKYNFFRQKRGGMPFSLSGLTTISMFTLEKTALKEYTLGSRIAYVNQIILSSRLHDRFTLQISPTIVHKNLVETPDDENTTYAIGIASKFNMTKVISINTEYIPRITGRTTPEGEKNFDSFSLGVGINTRGHFFEFHLTNSFPMVEKGYITCLLYTSPSPRDA